VSLYPILWAVEHAPVVDAEERAILSALVMKGSFDGRDCHRSYKTLGQVARCDRKTAERKCHAMEARGLLRRQTGPKPQSWHRLAADKKTVVWEVMIPADFWSAMQLEEINAARVERGLPPITRDNRPPLAPAPPKKTRADKGRKAPQRRPKSLPPKDDETAGQTHDEAPEPPERGDSQSPRSEESGGTTSPVAGGLQVPSRGDYKSPEPPVVPPKETSSSPNPSAVTAAPAADRQQEEEEEEPDGGQDERGDRAADLAEAFAVVDAATAQWWGPEASHRRPTQPERLRIAERVRDALTQGATPESVHEALTRDLEPAKTRSAVAVIMSRTAQPGWAHPLVPAPRPAAERPALPEHVLHVRQVREDEALRRQAAAASRTGASRAREALTRRTGTS
jgi:hypothetical protein